MAVLVVARGIRDICPVPPALVALGVPPVPPVIRGRAVAGVLLKAGVVLETLQVVAPVQLVVLGGAVRVVLGAMFII